MKQIEHVFHNEEQLLKRYREQLINNEDNDYKQICTNLTNNYAELLEQTRFITKVSDRLEKKLENSNQHLAEKNIELQQTLDELTRAQIGKRAMAIIYSVAIILFVLEEFFIEPLINMFGNSMWLGVLIKLMIVLLLKPAEGLLESKFLQMQRKTLNATSTQLTV